MNDEEWRKWMNQSFYVCQGVSFLELTDVQREAAFGMLGAALSAKGLQLTRDIMRLNHSLAELTDDNFDEYGEWQYYVTVMGAPSATEPWGFQLDGHHAIINYFVLGDQVVATPFFAGSEPVAATFGTELRRLVGLIELYVGNLDDGHAAVKMKEVLAHMDRKYLAWIGGTEAGNAFYYRIQSPVIIIEFDHQRPVGMRHLLDPNVPSTEHVHTVVRTPQPNRVRVAPRGSRPLSQQILRFAFSSVARRRWRRAGPGEPQDVKPRRSAAFRFSVIRQ